MGKNKGSQRTKGNVRPSNSGRSAELLSGSGNLNFIGFGSSKTQHIVHDIDDKVDGSFSMVMKKMQKRDTTTKLKAMQEFKELCMEKDRDVLIAVLPFWPRLYNKMALDCDRRIREATQDANAKLIEKVKRDIAPYLRSITGVWLLSQGDSYPPAASLAKETFSRTFPEEKQSEALMFCKEEIFQFIKDCLFEQTPQSLSDPNCTSEEKENKYTLVIAGALRGYKGFFTTISSEDRKTVQADAKYIVTENKFWKFAKHKTPQIRVAWYELASAFCHNLPEVFQNYEQKLGCLVFGCLSERDPSVAPVVWEAALHYIAAFQNCWDNVDIQKVVLPELWTLLKGGGNGNASLMFPCLLPFLSKLPVEGIKQKSNFFSNFFCSITKSLFLENVKRSTIECNAIITAFMECLQYVCMNIDFTGDENEIIEDLIFKELFSLVESSFTVDGTHLPVSKFYPLLGKFLQAMESYTIPTDSRNVKNITHALTLFWEKLFNVCLGVLEGEHLQQHADLVFLAYFFHCLYEPQNLLEKKKTGKVRFLDDLPKESSLCSPEVSSTVTGISHAERVNLFNCSLKVCIALCEKLKNNLEPHYIRLLTEILSAARCCELFDKLQSKLPEQEHDLEKAPLLFFQNVVTEWVHSASEKNQVAKFLADLTFAICSCLNITSALQVLRLCCKTQSKEFIKELLTNACTLHKEEKLFLKWFETSELVSAITDLFSFVAGHLTKACNVPETSNLESYFVTLTTCLTCTSNQEQLFPRSHIEEIIQVLASAVQVLLNTEPKTSVVFNPMVLEFICDISKHIFTNFEGSWFLPASEDLVVSFFYLCLSPALSEKDILRQKVSGIWTSYVKHLCCKNEPMSFISKAVIKLKVLILNPQTEEMSAVFMNTVSVLLYALLESVQNKSNDSSSFGINVISDFLEKILPSNSDWALLQEGVNVDWATAFLAKRLFYPLPGNKSVTAPVPAPQCIASANRVVDIIATCIHCSEETNFREMLVEHIFVQLPFLLWSCSYSESHGYLKNKDTNEYKLTWNLQKQCFIILAHLPKLDSDVFMIRLCEMSVVDSPKWCLPLDNTVGIFNAYQEDDVNVFNILQKVPDGEFSEVCATRQIVIRHLPAEEKKALFLSLVPEVMQSFNSENKQWKFDSLAEICCCFQDEVLLDMRDVYDSIVDILTRLLEVRKLLKYEDENFYVFSTQLAALLSEVILYAPDLLDSLWEQCIQFLSISLVQCRRIEDSICVQIPHLIYAHRCCSLLCDVFLLLSDEQLSPKPLTKLMVDKNFLLADISNNLLHLFLNISEICTSLDLLPKSVETCLSTLSHATEFLTPKQLLAVLVPVSLRCVVEERVNEALQKLVPLLTSSVRAVQLGVHAVFMKLMILFPAMLEREEKAGDEEENQIKLEPLVEHLKYTSHIVESMLSDFRVGDCCVVLPYTDSYTYTCAYLFAWNELLEFFSLSTTQERSAYATYLDANSLVSSMLCNLFRLMPENPFQCFQNHTGVKKKGNLKDIFCDPPALSPLDPPTVEDLQHVVCNTYYNALRKIPALVRTWWNNLDKRSSEVVNKFTSKYVSNLISVKEIQSVNESNVQFENMTIQARPGSGEVVATYTVDGSPIELLIDLPQNYPLTPCTIEVRGNVKIGQQQWRHWLMQLTGFLTYQNGSILDGILLWKKNLDKKFEGIEECLICFFILHATTAELPKRSCPTCKKKFHASCIHKWFVTSNNAACPLCRNLW